MNVVNTESRERRLDKVTTFTIDKDDNITTLTSAAEAKSNPATERFRNAKELARLAAAWPSSRLIEIWNSLPGVSPVRKFTSRQVMNRIWTAIQNLAADDGERAGAGAGKRGRTAKRATPVSGAREGSTTAMVLELLKRQEGATLKDLMAVTEWQAHSVRGFLSGTLRKKLGLHIESGKSADGERTYSIQA
jgi:Protein of unknown function (DUF3489)